MKKTISGISWSLDFGACKGLHWDVLKRFRKYRDISRSLPSHLDYDIFMVLDPDRVFHDHLDHFKGEIKKKISQRNLIGGVPLSGHQDYDYKKLFPRRPPGGYFDSLGLYYYPWPGNTGYYSFLSPLEDVTDISVIEGYPIPMISPEDEELLREDNEYIHSIDKLSAAYSGSLYEWSYYLRGRQKIYTDFYDQPELVDLVIEKIVRLVDRIVAVNINCGVDILCFFDDFGTQSGLQIKPDTFRRFYKNHYKRIWSNIKKYYSDKYIFLHSCGDISEIIPDLIECGLDILHPIQPETMSVNEIAAKYGNDLRLWGTISNQKTLAFGASEDINNEVWKRVTEVGEMAPLIISPSNTIGRDIPLENISVLIDACSQYTK